MLQITVDDPARLLALVDEVDAAVEESITTRNGIAVLLDDDAREVPEADLVRAVDAAVRSGEAPRALRALADRVARLDLTWDDVLDVRRPALDPEVAAARAALVDEGLARLSTLEVELVEN